MATVAASEKLISASLLRLRMKVPFFATLALFARFIPTTRHPTAATDGKDIYYNPDFLRGLKSPEQDGLLLHEVLHAALLHPIRRGVRDAKLWNIAADIVVNGIIAQQSGFDLPQGGLRDLKLEKLSVEEAYELLQQEASTSKKQRHVLSCPDLLSQGLSPDSDNAPSDHENLKDNSSGSNRLDTEEPKGNKSDDSVQEGLSDQLSSSSNAEGNAEGNTEVNEEGNEEGLSNKAKTANQPQTNSATASSFTETNATDSLSTATKAQLETHWENALQQATLIARTTAQGTLPEGIERELGKVSGPQLDWRSYLWRYLVQTPTDFQGFDRRFIHQGLYLEALQGESVQVYVCIDTSGSIDNTLLQLFFGEVEGILAAYPHLKCSLYYADADIYGPYELSKHDEMPTPKGGGGTSFIPFFDAVQDNWDHTLQSVCIYLTDGYGSFPTELPELPVLWVVTPGGLALEKFPFGEAVRLLSL